jgi:DNA-binding MarR family transcriptional regulator
MGTVEEWPLARLMALGTRVLVDGLHARLADRGQLRVRQGSGFVLVGVRRQAMTVTEIATLLGTTKQAASKLIALMKDDGLVDLTPHPTDSRARLVVITPHGEQFLATVEDIYRELEAEWAVRIGEDRLDAIRTDLTTVLSVDGQFPPIRPTL